MAATRPSFFPSAPRIALQFPTWFASLKQTGRQIYRQRQNARVEQKRDDAVQSHDVADRLAGDLNVRRLIGDADHQREMEKVAKVRGFVVARKHQAATNVAIIGAIELVRIVFGKA